MPRKKKTETEEVVEQPVEGEVQPNKVEVLSAESSKFPYKIKVQGVEVTVVAESLHPSGKVVYHSSDGCTYVL